MRCWPGVASHTPPYCSTDRKEPDLPRRIGKTDAWYIGIVMACGFITFYSLPGAMPFLVRLTMMVVGQVVAGKSFLREHKV